MWLTPVVAPTASCPATARHVSRSAPAIDVQGTARSRERMRLYLPLPGCAMLMQAALLRVLSLNPAYIG